MPKILMIALAAPVAVVSSVYSWPLSSSGLRRAPVAGWGYAEAEAHGQEVVAADQADSGVLPQARTYLRTHGKRTAKAVLLLHGYTGSPEAFRDLADYFFDRGYNVYVPRAPHHGYLAEATTPGLTAVALTDWANDGMNVTAGLGDEVGVVGLSGGAVMGTWLATLRPDVAHLLLLSPFFAPAAGQAPPAAVKPMTVLWGHRLLPDRTVPGTTSRYSDLAQYLRIVANLDERTVTERLKSIAVVIADGDDLIDLFRATELPGQLAEVNDIQPELLHLGKDFGHELARATEPGVPGLYPRYFKLYEG